MEPTEILALSMISLLLLGMCAQAGMQRGGVIGKVTKPAVILALLLLVAVLGMVGLWGALDLEDTDHRAGANWKSAADRRIDGLRGAAPARDLQEED